MTQAACVRSGSRPVPDAAGLVLASAIGIVAVGLARALPPSPFVST